MSTTYECDTCEAPAKLWAADEKRMHYACDDPHCAPASLAWKNFHGMNLAEHNAREVGFDEPDGDATHRRGPRGMPLRVLVRAACSADGVREVVAVQRAYERAKALVFSPEVRLAVSLFYPAAHLALGGDGAAYPSMTPEEVKAARGLCEAIDACALPIPGELSGRPLRYALDVLEATVTVEERIVWALAHVQIAARTRRASDSRGSQPDDRRLSERSNAEELLENLVKLDSHFAELFSLFCGVESPDVAKLDALGKWADYVTLGAPVPFVVARLQETDPDSDGGQGRPGPTTTLARLALACGAFWGAKTISRTGPKIKNAKDRIDRAKKVRDKRVRERRDSTK